MEMVLVSYKVTMSTTLHMYNNFEAQKYLNDDFVVKCILVKKCNVQA